MLIKLGALQRKENSKNPRLLWKWMGGSRSHSEFFFGKSSQNSPKPLLIFWSTAVVYHVYSVCTYIAKVVGYYNLSVLSMSVMGFQKKKVWMGWVGGVSSIQVFFGF